MSTNKKGNELFQHAKGEKTRLDLNHLFVCRGVWGCVFGPLDWNCMLEISRVGGQERSGQWGLKQCKRWDDVKETEGKVKDDNLRKVNGRKVW